MALKPAALFDSALTHLFDFMQYICHELLKEKTESIISNELREFGVFKLIVIKCVFKPISITEKPYSIRINLLYTIIFVS